VGRLSAALLGASVTAGLLGTAERIAPQRLVRTNHRGQRVSLVAGPVLAVASAAAAAAGAGTGRLRAAVLLAGLGAGAAGCYDDVAGARPAERADKGFRGHLAALRQGRVSAGAVKVGGIGAVALVAGALLPAAADESGGATGGAARRDAGRAAGEALLAAGVVAGTANLVNLFDLRPGRALKVGLLLGVPLLGGAAAGPAAGALGAAAALLPADLGERVMLGDTGANALGAVLGVALAASTSTGGRAGALAVLVALTAASERVSFTRVIDATPGLRELDALGRRPPSPAPVR